MKILDIILSILSDGEWYNIKEILLATNMNPLKLLFCINFLDHTDFIQIDRIHGRVKVSPGVKSLLDGLNCR